MTKWEYAQFNWSPGVGKTREVRLPDGEVISKISSDFSAVLEISNDLGADGWEMVAFNFLDPGVGAFFKRRVEE